MTKHTGRSEIVIVDDDEMETLLLQRYLSASDVETPLVPFHSSEAFLKHMEQIKHGAAELPACILLDINMPMISGWDVLEHLRKEAAYKAVPIFMLTNSNNPEERARAENHGARFQRKFLSKTDGVAFFNGLAELFN